MDHLLSIRNLQLYFDTEQGPVEVIDQINMSIGRGEIVGLVGESGCGKTTLANAILGVLPADSTRVVSGEIHFHGRDLLRTDPEILNEQVRGRAISVIPQDPFGSFNPLFTIGEQLMDLMKWKSPLRVGRNGGRPHQKGFGFFARYPSDRYATDRKAVLDMLRTVQIADPEGSLVKYPYELSGGQRQRIMIAMAILPQPDLIIADECTTALDVTIQAQILKLLKKIVKEREISVLFTTHDLGTAYEVCDRIWVMYAGQQMEVAPTRSFFARPSHPYTHKLLGSLPHPQRELMDIPGEVPGLIRPPPGCRFYPRCEHAQERCRQSPPGETQVAENHTVRCYYPLHVARE